MRVWDCDPRLLCDKHLRAQHAEIHFAIRAIENGWKTKWKDVERFRRSEYGLDWLKFVHDATVVELRRRGKFANHATPVGEHAYQALLAHWTAQLLFDTRLWPSVLELYGYPLTELNQGTPWERDGVSFEWYREHEKDWTRAMAEAEGARNLAKTSS